MTDVVALVPMRHESERVPGKNYRAFAGRPLFHHVVECLLRVPQVREVVIDTDSPIVTADVAHHFPQVRVVERPEHLRAGDVSMNDVLAHDAGLVEADWYVQTHSTNPLLRPETVGAAMEALESSPDHDSLFSVTPLRTRLWWPDGRPVNHDPSVLVRTQDLDPVYVENSNLYIFDRTTILTTGSRLGRRPLLFPMAAEEAWDIDDELDFVFGEQLFRARATS